MPYQVGTTCYAEAQQALSAVASAQVGAIVTRGGAPYVVDAQSVTGQSITYRFQSVDGGAAFATTLNITPQPCQLLTAADGALLGWAIASAWICTAVVMNLRKAIHE